MSASPESGPPPESTFSRPRSPAARPLPVLVLADVSSSMAEWGKIDVLNRSVAAMLRAFAEERSDHGQIHVGVIIFGGSTARVHIPLAPAAQVRWTDMTADGVTPMAEAFDLARQQLDDESVVPRPSSRPCLILCSDGYPTGPDGYPSDDWKLALDRLLTSRRGQRALRLAVGIGPDMTDEARAVLAAFVADPAIPVIQAERVEMVTQFFQWATATVTTGLHGGVEVPPLHVGELGRLL